MGYHSACCLGSWKGSHWGCCSGSRKESHWASPAVRNLAESKLCCNHFSVVFLFGKCGI